MGLEIDKYNGINSQQELIQFCKLNSDEKEKIKKINRQKAVDKTNDNINKSTFDLYKKHVVSDSIEQQIKEQQAKIKEINENLDGLREEYYKTSKKEEEAIFEKQLKARELYQKEISESGLKRMYENWRKKYMADRDDEKVKDKYNHYHIDYDDAVAERKLADKDYDIADADAFAAIAEHNSADTDFLVGLWRMQDAYWDLAKMQQRYSFAKLRESKFDI